MSDTQPTPKRRGRAERRAAQRSAAQARALARSPAQCFAHGCAQAAPLLLVVAPFGLLFGIVATEAGFDLLQVMGFSVLVLAGASQFTAVQLLSDHAPTLLVLVSALAVNLRMAMYSAALVPWIGQASAGKRALMAYMLIDQTYALSIQHYEDHPKLSLPQRLSYFFGTALVMCPPWFAATLIGATMGRIIPASWPLDFAVPITFLALIAPGLRSLPQIIAAAVAVVLALVFAGLPSGMGLLIAAPCAMAAGALSEIWLERRRGPTPPSDARGGSE